MTVQTKPGTISRPVRTIIGTLEDPPLAGALFGDVRWSWIWLIVRLYVGWQWLSEGIDKVTSPAWAGAKAGLALSGWVSGSLAKASGPHLDMVCHLSQGRRPAACSSVEASWSATARSSSARV